MRCEHCGQILEHRPDHWFAGYGWYVIYHPECCPREFDGTTCDKDHPDPNEVPPRPKRPIINEQKW